MRVPGIPYIQGRNDYTDNDGKKYGIAIHNTSNDASDSGEASYATRRTDGVSSHFYCDIDSVTQSIDTDDRVGHAGSNTGNENAIAVEITGGNGMSRAWWLNNVAWNKLASVLVYVITNDPDYEGFQIRRASVAEMKSNPKVKAFYGHNDMRLAWGGTTHTDPGNNFPWDLFLTRVKTALAGDTQEDDDMPFTEAQMRAFPWQYTGRGMPGVPDGSSTLWTLGTAYSTAQEVKAKVELIATAVNGLVAEDLKTELDKLTAKFEAERVKSETQFAQAMAAIDQVDENVLEAIDSSESPTVIAERLRAVLGDKADAVFQAGLALPPA